MGQRVMDSCLATATCVHSLQRPPTSTIFHLSKMLRSHCSNGSFTAQQGSPPQTVLTPAGLPLTSPPCQLPPPTEAAHPSHSPRLEQTLPEHSYASSKAPLKRPPRGSFSQLSKSTDLSLCPHSPAQPLGPCHWLRTAWVQPTWPTGGELREGQPLVSHHCLAPAQRGSTERPCGFPVHIQHPLTPQEQNAPRGSGRPLTICRPCQWQPPPRQEASWLLPRTSPQA